MDLKDLLRSDRLKEEKTGQDKIVEFLEFAETEIEAANYLLPKFSSQAYKSAYDALIHAGNALVGFYGRPHAEIHTRDYCRVHEQSLRQRPWRTGWQV